MVLGTANRSEPRPGLDFFPLTVDFEERMYAAGKIPGGFIKREGRSSEGAILAARLTDRPIRPLFPEGYKDDVQIVITVLSTDQENDPDILGTIAASAALTISEIPFQGPVGAVRVGRIDGEFVLNPVYSQLEEPELDPVASGTCAGRRRACGELGVGGVESTGFDPTMAYLVEVAGVPVKGSKVTYTCSTLVNPGRPIIGNHMHGIKDADVKGAKSPAEAERKLFD